MTTRTTPREPWDDERLTAAFGARAAQAVTPVDLARATSAALRTQPRSAGTWRTLLAPAAVVILAIGAVSGMALIGGQRGSNAPSEPNADPSSSPSSSGPPDASEAARLPVISVVDAIAVRDAGADDREIAVRAWYAPYLPNRACGRASNEEPVWPLLVACPEDRLWLMQDPEPVMTVTDSGLSWRGPTGPAISAAFGEVDRSWAFPIEDTTRLVELVVVGHFDDRRSAACPADVGQACRDRFVVDRIDSVDGETLPTSQIDLVEGIGMPFEEVERIIDAVKPGVSVLSAVHVDGDHGLRRMEPALAERGGSLIGEPMLWVVGVLDAGTLETYVIVDSSGSIYELTADGPVLVALSTPGEPVWPSPSQRPETESFLTMVVGLDQRVSIEVADHTGFMEDARHATSTEMARPSGVARPGELAIENLAQDTILVRWTGTVCDRQPQLTIGSSGADGPPSVLHLTSERTACDAMGIGRGVVMRFAIEVDAGDLDGTEEIRLVDPRPTAVVGLEVIDMEAALEIQASPGDDREIAVGGWFIRGGEAACAVPDGQAPPSHLRPPGWPLEPDCRARFDQFLEDDAPRDLLSVQAVLGPLGYGWMEDGRNRHEVVFVGHFDDRRASACDEGRQPGCADAFWVDAIWYQGQLVATDWSFAATAPIAETPKGSRRGVETLDAPWSHGTAEILSVGLVSRAWLPDLEPVIQDPMLVGDTWAWHITALDKATKRVRTFVIGDSALMDTPGGPNYRIYEVVGDEVFVTATIID
jgi:hypothetical protein